MDGRGSRRVDFLPRLLRGADTRDKAADALTPPSRHTYCTAKIVVRFYPMPSRSSTVVQLRVDEKLKQAFADAARREQTTPSSAMRSLMEDFVQDSFRKEAARQSRIVAAAPDFEETMDEIARLSAWMHD